MASFKALLISVNLMFFNARNIKQTLIIKPNNNLTLMEVFLIVTCSLLKTGVCLLNVYRHYTNKSRVLLLNRRLCFFIDNAVVDNFD